MQATDKTSSKPLKKNVLYNLIGLSVPMIVAVFAIPKLITALGTARFGVLTLIWVVISYASLFDLGLGRALTQQLSIRLVTAKEESAKLVWTSLISLTALGTLGGVLLYVLTPWLVQDLLHVPQLFKQETQNAFYIMAFSLPFIIATDCVRGVLEAHQSFFIVNAVRLPMGIFTFVGPILALLLSNNLAMIAIFLAVGKIINFLLYFAHCFKVMPNLKKNFSFNKKDLGPLFTLGGWTTLSNIINPLMGYLDRFFIAGISLSAVTYYVTPNEMITKLWLIPGAINAVYFPEFAASFINNTKKAKDLFDQNLKYIFLLLFPIVVFVVYFAHELLYLWLGSHFADVSYQILQWLAIGVLINSLAQVPCSVIQAKGKAILTAKVSLFELPIYAGMLWLGVKYGNIATVAIIWLCRMLVDALVMFALARRFIHFQLSRQVIVFTSMVCLLLFLNFIVMNFLIKILLFTALILTICILFWHCFLTSKSKTNMA